MPTKTKAASKKAASKGIRKTLKPIGKTDDHVAKASKRSGRKKSEETVSAVDFLNSLLGAEDSDMDLAIRGLKAIAAQPKESPVYNSSSKQRKYIAEATLKILANAKASQASKSKMLDEALKQIASGKWGAK